MKSDRVPVMVGRSDYELVKTYSQITGIPATRVIAEALSDWCNTVGKVRLEVLTSQTIDMPVQTSIQQPLKAMAASNNT